MLAVLRFLPRKWTSLENDNSMTLENATSVDAIGIESTTDFAVLTLGDSWDWTNEQAHLNALQDKLNAYFQFIESGQVWESYPAARGRKLVIDVVTRFPLSAAGQNLLNAASDIASDLGAVIRHKRFEGSQTV